MTKEDFDTRFSNAWSSAMSPDEIETLAKESAASEEPLLTAIHFLMNHQKAAVKSVLKEFHLNDPR